MILVATVQQVLVSTNFLRQLDPSYDCLHRVRLVNSLLNPVSGTPSRCRTVDIFCQPFIVGVEFLGYSKVHVSIIFVGWNRRRHVYRGYKLEVLNVLHLLVLCFTCSLSEIV